MSLLSSIAPVASAGDDRAYRVIELPNKLRAILVSDPLTDKVRHSPEHTACLGGSHD
jgi:secreted Zn-dependent insulinase-like peptidase